MSTVGSLIDELMTAAMKVWHLQDWVYRVERMPPEEFARLSHAEIQAQICKLAQVNLKRNQLISEIDRRLDEAIQKGRAETDPRTKLT
jgi:hypothetical protein